MSVYEKRIVVMNFSGIYKEMEFWKDCETDWVEAQDISGTNCYCDEAAQKEIRSRIAGFSHGGIRFLDSGNYHYMSRIWMERQKEPFQLLVFDNHTDMQPPAFGGLLSCGGWLEDAMESLPNLRRVILAGPDEEAFAQISRRHRESVRFLSREALKDRDTEKNRDFFRQIPTDWPLYLSVDKDVLAWEECRTGWSQGDMKLHELLDYLRLVLTDRRQEEQGICGIDICGECSPGQEGIFLNERVNRKLLNLLAGKD